ncbi:Speckle-type POZ protein like [Argiope bruennichi]|uniref:Speckle-type POZ protein like n=1 Tax=Argiope bruennichi TaxID=94029 RepID=A0A8T0EH87_ARGBR|nr:Speckle-type POZ protein like [Argiope bruennichi]
MASEKKGFSVKWRIEKFRSWLQKQESILYSPEFVVETMEGSKWKLCISAKCDPTMKYIGLSLLREIEDDGPELIDLYCELSFLANDGSPIKLEVFAEKFGNGTGSQELMVKKDTVLNERKCDYLPEENLTVSCRMWRNRASVARNGRCFIRSVIGLERMTLEGIVENFQSELLQLQDRNKRECKKKYSKPEYVPLSAIDTWYAFRLPSTPEDLIAQNFLPNDILTLQYEVAFSPGIELEHVEYDFPQDASGFADSNVHNSDEYYDVTDNTQRLESAGKAFAAEEEQSDLITSFKRDMMSLYNDHYFCDIVLQSGTETFLAHRSVLSARSPVFKKMFTTDMKEKTSESINIFDLSPDTISRMLFYIYTDTIHNLDWTNVKELYFASDIYEILTLKRRCSLFIKQNLTPSNVYEVLILADTHQDDDLKSTVQEYILRHDEEIFGSSEWKLFMDTNCHLAAQIMYLKCLKK